MQKVDSFTRIFFIDIGYWNFFFFFFYELLNNNSVTRSVIIIVNIKIHIHNPYFTVRLKQIHEIHSSLLQGTLKTSKCQGFYSDLLIGDIQLFDSISTMHLILTNTL